MKPNRSLNPKKLLPAIDRFLEMTAGKILDLDEKWDPAKGTPEDASTMARATLKSVRGKIQTALGKGSLDAATRAHLDETMARIDAALSAQMMRMAG